MDFLATSRMIEARLAEGRRRADELSEHRKRVALDVVLGDGDAKRVLARIDADLSQVRAELRNLEDARPELQRRRAEDEAQARAEGEKRDRALSAGVRAAKRREVEEQIKRFEWEGNHHQAAIWRDHLARHPDYAEATT